MRPRFVAWDRTVLCNVGGVSASHYSHWN